MVGSGAGGSNYGIRRAVKPARIRLARSRTAVQCRRLDTGQSRGQAMKTKTVEVPEEILELLQRSRLGGRSEPDQVRTALAIHLFLEGVISVGKAAELAGEPRVDFEWQMVEMGLPTVQYDLADYEQDQRNFAEAARRHDTP